MAVGRVCGQDEILRERRIQGSTWDSTSQRTFIRDLKLAATLRDMTVTQFVLDTMRPEVDEALDELTELMEDRQSSSRRT